MRNEALNGLKRGDMVRYIKSNGKQHGYQRLNNGTVEDVSLSGKQIYVRGVDGRGNYLHWAK